MTWHGIRVPEGASHDTAAASEAFF
jgi:hypothetical protein